jgi:ribonuclease T2
VTALGRIAKLLLFAMLLAGCTNTPPATVEKSPTTSPAQASAGSQPDSGTAGDLRGGSAGRKSRRARPAANSQPGAFDFYLLTLSWSPEFCATHPSSSECSAHPGFVVHGMWPQNNDGTYPQNCSTAAGPANPEQHLDLIPTVSLVSHEWATHGTCSGLEPEAYFGAMRRAFRAVRIPAMFVNGRSPGMMAPSAVIGEFAAANPSWPMGSIALSCGKNYLTAVEVCLSKTLAPEACQNVHTCGATVVKVTPQ